MNLTGLFKELLAISLIDIEECKKNNKKMQYLGELILDLYEKIGDNIDDEIIKSDDWIMAERNKIKIRIIKDRYLKQDQKIILYNNFAQDKIESKSQFRRIMMMEKK